MTIFPAGLHSLDDHLYINTNVSGEPIDRIPGNEGLGIEAGIYRIKQCEISRGGDRLNHWAKSLRGEFKDYSNRRFYVTNGKWRV